MKIVYPTVPKTIVDWVIDHNGKSRLFVPRVKSAGLSRISEINPRQVYAWRHYAQLNAVSMMLGKPLGIGFNKIPVVFEHHRIISKLGGRLHVVVFGNRNIDKCLICFWKGSHPSINRCTTGNSRDVLPVTQINSREHRTIFQKFKRQRISRATTEETGKPSG